MKIQIAKSINLLGEFLGKRDMDELSREKLKEKYGLDQVDVMVLFGGSILAGGDVLAQAIKDKVAKKYIIVGGAGHTTETLRQQVHREYPQIETDNLTEAEIFQGYLKNVHDCAADELETQSTNCGNNITYLLELLRRKEIPFKSIILTQDASMQNRMDAGLRKYAAEDITIINYAAYAVEIRENDEELDYVRKPHGMWTVERYVDLLMGEIPRLTDDLNGYGPQGKGYIAHVDIPKEVITAFEELKQVYGSRTREANPLYASKQYTGF